MSKTILLGNPNNISINASKWISAIIGIMYLGMGLIKLWQEGFSFYAAGYIVLGTAFGVYAFVVFSTTLFTPRVDLDDNGLKLRNKVFGKTTRLSWQDIVSIDFDTYEINFNLKSGVHSFSYTSNTAISIEIKQSIREMAEPKGIIVSAG